MNTIEEQARDAVINRLWMHAVGIVNSIRTVGYDPTTGGRGDTEEPGSGCVGRWGDHHFILTAKHVVEKAQPGELRVFCRPSGGIEYRTPGELRRKDIVDAAPLNGKNAVIYRCEWEDLALITTTPKAVPKMEFFDAVKDWIDPQEGETLHCFGFPFDHGQMVGKKMVGTKEERNVALYATIFSAPVLPLPTEDELKFRITDFHPDRHYLVPYELAAKGKHPRGYSGGGMWWESDEKQIIWRPNFKFAGVCTACHKDGTIVQAVKASVVRLFLEEVFGPAE